MRITCPGLYRTRRNGVADVRIVNAETCTGYILRADGYKDVMLWKTKDGTQLVYGTVDDVVEYPGPRSPMTDKVQ